ncbi:MAG: hypothetical protein JEZ08_16655 [Clostridiales bacterium]|nr:hypothetical protein [Clostridiales bacterium]
MKTSESMYIVIENKSLSPISITEIMCLFENRYKFLFKRFNTPLIISPFTTSLIEMEHFSSISKFSMEKLTFQIKTSKNNKCIRFGKKFFIISRKLIRSKSNLTVLTKKYNGKIYDLGTKFVLEFVDESKIETIFIHKGGIMSEAVLGYNGIPSTEMNDIESVRKILDSLLRKKGIDYKLTELNLEV